MERRAMRMLWMVLLVVLVAVQGQARGQDRQAELARLQATMDEIEAAIRWHRDAKSRLESGQLVVTLARVRQEMSAFNPLPHSLRLVTPDERSTLARRFIGEGVLTPEMAAAWVLRLDTMAELLPRTLGEEIDNLQKEYDKTRSAWIDANWLPESARAAAARWVGRWTASAGERLGASSIEASPEGWLCFANDGGPLGCGRLLSPTEVIIEKWLGGLRAKLFVDGNRIDFANGTFWTRYGSGGGRGAAPPASLPVHESLRFVGQGGPR